MAVILTVGNVKLDIPDRPCACGCGEFIAGRYANGKPTYNRYLLGHAATRIPGIEGRKRIGLAREQRFRQTYPDNKRVCPKCEEELDLDAFHYSGRWRELCQPCHKAESRRRYAMRNYGISIEEYDALLLVASCAICGVPPEESEKGILFMDHDHVTGAIRDMLCSTCNKGLGSFRDDPVRLRAAADYIEKHREVGQ